MIRLFSFPFRTSEFTASRIQTLALRYDLKPNEQSNVINKLSILFDHLILLSYNKPWGFTRTRLYLGSIFRSSAFARASQEPKGRCSPRSYPTSFSDDLPMSLQASPNISTDRTSASLHPNCYRLGLGSAQESNEIEPFRQHTHLLIQIPHLNQFQYKKKALQHDGRLTQHFITMSNSSSAIETYPFPPNLHPPPRGRSPQLTETSLAHIRVTHSNRGPK